MSIFYDKYGFVHETEGNAYYRDGFTTPLFDFEKNCVSDEFVSFLKSWFSTNFSQEKEMEKNIDEVEKNEVSKQPNEVYVMIGNGFDIECGLPTAYGDFLIFLKTMERVGKNSEDRLEDIALKPQI